MTETTTKLDIDRPRYSTAAMRQIKAEARRIALEEAAEIIVQKTQPGTETICYEISAAIRKLALKEAKG